MKPRKPTPLERAIAAEIAATLGETEERPRCQIERIVGLMGEEWTRARLPEAWDALGDASTPMSMRADGGPRTMGGAFFAVARAAAKGISRITRRDFFRCFFDFPPQARPQRTTRPPRKAPPPPVRREARRAPEVYTRRAPR